MIRRHQEDGAVAILVAILAIALFGFAALAVDLSNAFVRKRDVQRQVDFAALAGGAELGASYTGPVPAAAVNAVSDQLNGPGGVNLVRDGDTFTPVASGALTDSNQANGEVMFTTQGLRVIAPRVRVDYSVAKAIGFDFTQVQADATVGVFSPGVGVMPVYAIDGCDWSNQTITDPAAGANPVIPPLAHDLDSNATVLDSLAPAEVPLNASGFMVDLTGRDFVDVTKVGFFRADDTNAALVVEQPNFTPTHAATGFNKSGNGTIRFEIPAAVTAIEKAWYVRVYSAGTVNKWSARAEALPLRVGDAVLECAAGSSDGNFGTLKLPRNNPVDDASWLPVNIADGFEEPLSLAVHEQATDGYCSNGLNGAIESVKPDLLPRTNCVDTDTGLPANVATEGLITLNSGSGRLVSGSSSTSERGGCAPDGSSSPRMVNLPNPYYINNDTLTCFLTDTATSLAEIADPHYNGGPKLSPDIYSSPRFFWQPILKVEPDNGGSNRYSIVDFRPAFITDELVVPTTTRNTWTASAENGLVVDGNQIKQIKVVFFHADALPADDNGQAVTPYLGVGPKLLRLVD